MVTVPCSSCGITVPVVNPYPGGFYPEQVARHATGPLREIARGYWRRLPCWGSGRIVGTASDGSKFVRVVWWTDNAISSP